MTLTMGISRSLRRASEGQADDEKSGAAWEATQEVYLCFLVFLFSFRFDSCSLVDHV